MTNFKHFKHLHVPDHWQQYWSKYPQGYTIMEALINWVSQVDRMTDNINNWNNYLDQFVETFDTKLQGTVKETVQSWIDDGTIHVIISEALQWQLDDYITTNEQDKLSIKSQLAEKATKQGVGNSDYIWNPPIQPSLTSILPGMDYELFIAKWENLRSEFPDYITREILGLDESGTYNIYKYIFEPEKFDKTVIVNAGIHGNELAGVALAYRFFYHLCHDSEQYQQLFNARQNIRYIVIPVLNPWGYVNNTRGNANSVDINRNFDYKWASTGGEGTSAMSEAETNHIANVLTEYSEAVGYIDIHNTGILENIDFYCSIPQLGYNHNVELRKIMEDLSPVNNFNPRISYFGGAITSNYSQFVKGISSITAEFVPASFGTVQYSANDMTNGLAYIANIILYMSSLEKLRALEIKEPFVKTFYTNDSTLLTTTSTAFVDVPDVILEFEPKVGGILIINGSLGVLSVDETKNVYGVCVAIQAGNPAIAVSTETSQENSFNSLVRASRGNIPLSRVVQILPKSDGVGNVLVKLKMKVDSGNTGQHLNSRLNLTFIPSNNWNVESYGLDSNSNLVLLHPTYI